jgi:hypothetical protein
VLKSISNIGKPHGLAWIPEPGRFFDADGSLAAVRV